MMNITQHTKNEIMKRIAFFMGTYMNPNIGIMMKNQETEIDNRHYYKTKNQIIMTTQIKKVGKYNSPNRVSRSTHYIRQPRSTGCNH